MFESFSTEPDRGLPAFLSRHLGSVRDAGLAEEEIHRIALFFISLGVVTGIVGVAIYDSPGSLGTGLVLVVAALTLYLSKSRISALILLGLLLANAWLHVTAPFFWIWVVVALRATQLAFGYQRLPKTRFFKVERKNGSLRPLGPPTNPSRMSPLWSALAEHSDRRWRPGLGDLDVFPGS